MWNEVQDMFGGMYTCIYIILILKRINQFSKLKKLQKDHIKPKINEKRKQESWVENKTKNN